MSAADKGCALLLKRTDYRESDLIVTLFTWKHGKIQALARGARRSRKRFAGSLEPIHTLAVELSESKRNQWFDLQGASIHTARLHIPQHLDRLQAAGRVFGWLRQALPEHCPELTLWSLTLNWLDELDAAGEVDCTRALGAFALQLLEELGWGLDFEHCVKCGTLCPAHKPATISATQGGLICAACGAAKTRLSALARQRLAEVASGRAPLLPQDAELALRLAEEALGAHADLI